MQATLPGLTRPGVSRIGLGCRAFTGPRGPLDARSAAALVGFAADKGVALIDGLGSALDSAGRRQVRRVVADRREEILLTAHVHPLPGRAPGGAAACDAELRRMAVGYLDICFLHPTGSGIPIEDHVGDLAESVAAGKIRRLGIAGGSSQDLRRAHATHPIDAFSTPYSLLERRSEADGLPTARELGLMVVAAAPLGQGVLTNHTLNPCSAEASRRPVLAQALRELQELATELNIGSARLALAWLLSQGPDIVPVPSTRDRVHLEMNVMAQRVHVPPEVAARLAEVFPVGGFDPAQSE
jgi:aryl-alcohol dehydrogenase-like predicted oxidoreductase